MARTARKYTWTKSSHEGWTLQPIVGGPVYQVDLMLGMYIVRLEGVEIGTSGSISGAVGDPIEVEALVRKDAQSRR